MKGEEKLMEQLRATSCMAPNMDHLYRMVTHYLAERLGRAIAFVIDLPWPERYRQLDAGVIHLGWICGAPYVERRVQQTLELLAAPVWRGAHYEDRPIYYSTLLVHNTNSVRQFADLRGQRWVYNEPGSLSGYHVMRAHLALVGERMNFFSAQIEAGSHQRAIQMVADRQADVAAVDSTVFEQVVQDEPAVVAAVRSLGLLGPNPIPPLVIRQDVPLPLRQEIRELLLTMAQDQTGAAILATTPVTRFARVEEEDYKPIATLLQHSYSLG